MHILLLLIGTDENLLNCLYPEEKDVLIELISPPTPYPHPTPLDKDNLIGTHQCLSRVGGCAH